MHPNGSNAIKIAVTDDHVMFREALCQQLNTWENCRVVLQAGNGKELINALSERELPDLAFVDLCMPVMNGYETIRELRKHFPSIRILVISMYGSEEAICRVRKEGANGFINKVDEMGKIRKAVEAVMKDEYFFSERVPRSLRKKEEIDLTEEELSFLRFICTEKTYKAIAAEMGISGRHAEYLRYNLFERFDVVSRTGLAMRVVEKGLVI